VTSTTGTGVASEGGSLDIRNSRIHDCQGHGLAVFADLEGAGGRARVTRTLISGNRLNGVLVREDSNLQLLECLVSNNLAFGIASKVRNKYFMA
jgi:hypothetical protein